MIAMMKDRFRTDNNVVVEDGITHETIHTPPDCCEVEGLIDSICRLFNDDDFNGVFIHPIVKGIIIHFLIAFIHPFVDEMAYCPCHILLVYAS